MYTGFRVKYSLFLSDFNETLVSSTDSLKIQISNFTKIFPMGAELFHADRENRYELGNSRFSQVAFLTQHKVHSTQLVRFALII